MKIFILLLLCPFICNCQITNEDKSLLQFVTHVDGKTTYAYCREASDLTHDIKRIKRKRVYERIVYPDDLNKKDSILKIIISDRELEEILMQIEENKNYNFPENVLTNSIRIPKDSIKNFIKSKTQKFYDNMHSVFKSGDSLKIKEFRNKTPQLYEYKHDCYVSFFSKPIYIRNRTIALVSNGLFCNGGYNELYFYEKKNNDWKKIVSISTNLY